MRVGQPFEVALAFKDKPIEIRQAISPDALSVAEIHVESWKYAYRGLLADSILDSLTVESRIKHWVRVIVNRICGLQRKILSYWAG